MAEAVGTTVILLPGLANLVSVAIVDTWTVQDADALITVTDCSGWA